MTTAHLTPDEFATYLIGEAMRRKLAGRVDRYGPLGAELDLLKRWIVRGLAASELALVQEVIPGAEIGDLELAEIGEPDRPCSTPSM